MDGYAGGIPVVILNDEVGVACESAAIAGVEVPVPTLSFWALATLLVFLGLIALTNRKRQFR